MKNFDEIVVIAAGNESADSIPPVAGAQRVWGVNNGRPGSRAIGWLMPEVKNHVKEQPTNKWKQALIDRERAKCAPQGWSHAGPDA